MTAVGQPPLVPSIADAGAAVLAAEIVERPEAALEEFRSVEEVLAGNGEVL